MKRLLIANRGEIAIRIARAAADLSLLSAGVYARDDAASLHRRRVDEAAALPGSGPAAYLDMQAMLDAAAAMGCDAIHPGYGFLSENARFAALCQNAGLIFVGPSPEALALFGDKASARKLAADLNVPTPAGTGPGISLKDAEAFRAGLGHGAEVMLKAAAGGGGRGMRRVAQGEDLGRAFALCLGEAKAAFGDDRLYAEAVVPQARHVEVQVVADGERAVAVHDRDCSIQRARQKLVELAPAPGLERDVRRRLQEWSVRMAKAGGLRGLATFEFLVPTGDQAGAVFIEANPRLQVEHTVTEAVTGLDLVQIQLRLARGEDLAACGLADGAPPAQGFAIQLRVNLERLRADGSIVGTAGGVLAAYEPPSGPGVRVDGYGYGGYQTHPGFDPLLAKVIVQGATPGLALARARRAAAEFRIGGVETNLSLLCAILEGADLDRGVDTLFVERNLADLLARAAMAEGETAQLVLPTGQDRAADAAPAPPPGTLPVTAPLRGTVVSLDVAAGGAVAPGQTVAVVEAMKMQHEVVAPRGGVVRHICVKAGETIDEGWPVAFIEPDDRQEEAVEAEAVDLDQIRPDLAALQSRLALTLDENRPEAVARRRSRGQRTARENLGDLFDPGSFKEFSALAIAAQRGRRTLDDLRRNTPADGVITGFGDVSGRPCAALAYDFTVLAGTQGYFSHKKTDQLLHFAERSQLPIVWYTEGGGGRPGDIDMDFVVASWLDTPTFTTFARLSGVAPRIAIASGRCFAGNAVFFGCADVTIATRYANIGLGGPAMIEGGGLGVFTPDEVGPSHVQYANGAVDLLVEDEAAATAAAKQLLGVLQGTVEPWTCADQRLLRRLIPQNRLRAYDIRKVIEVLADEDSFLELRGGYGRGMITGFVRIEGRPLGLIANDPQRLGGAIDAEGGEKAGRFMQLCDAFDVPLLSLCDTPGFMVGPQSEEAASVRRASRLFVTAQSLTVPIFAVILRKAYGLGGQAMHGGDFSASALTVVWPTAECGPMGLEGAVRLGFSKELDAEADPAARQALFDRLLAGMYENGDATAVAEAIEVTAVIDPAETRSWISRGLVSRPPSPPRLGRRRFIDVW